ncbi:vertebrate ancient long opsin a isoform X1 [Erpetoichthys calabaricus]|uniref:Vertebrate ancient long opsin a n=1 Tax=Erpetoichthys calabaricus TaxID=27687 RepID=A0A8C4SEV8_ERPCA|nr:vertebrate ancient long opsin a isoform X1 [Erpetoichthys calabaricus]
MDAFKGSVNGVLYTEAAEIFRHDDPFNGPVESIEPWNFKFLAALMFLITVLSLSENFTVMLVTFKFKQLRQPLNYIILNLSLADFLVSLIGGTISFLTNIKGYFFMGAWACVMEGFAVTFFGIVALWSLAVLAFERFFVICRPLGNIRLRGKHAALGIVFVWTFSFIWTIPPVLGWSSYTVSKIGTTCEPNWYSGDYFDHTYIITFFTTCFILPLAVIIVSYGKLMRKLRKVSDTQGRLGSTRKPERQVTRMVVVMIVAFLICWTPYAAFSIIVTACPTIYLDPRLAAVPAFFSKTATVYNPVIYVFMNKQFRKCLIQLFHCNNDAIDLNFNQTTERGGITAGTNEGEMSTIAARFAKSAVEKTLEEASRHSSLSQLPVAENKVCPM